MVRVRNWLGILVVLAGEVGAIQSAEVPATGNDQAAVFFEKRVRPILAARCWECHAHGAKVPKGGLELDSHLGLQTGGDSGPAVLAGAPDESRLILAVRYDDPQLQMPPAGKLPDAEIAVLREWVQRGAVFPESGSVSTARRSAREGASEAGRDHWAFRPFAAESPALPGGTQAATWGQSRLDAYVRAGQGGRDLSPAAEAPRELLIRRLKLDLLGLPPGEDEIEEFLHDPRPDAYERLVDQFLASPHYGERWGRHWLDLARYCDVPESWREKDGQPWLYRDWVIQAWNADLPYPRFVELQLAADLVPEAVPQDLAALGFLGLSPTYWKELKLDHVAIKQVVAEEWEERIEALGGTFLGLTLACARCHDHKYDPITMADYYGLAGVLASSKLVGRSLLPEPVAGRVRSMRAQVTQAEQQIAELLKSKPLPEESRLRVESLRREIEQWQRDTPELARPEAFGLVEASIRVLPDGPDRTKIEYLDQQPQDVAIQIRGNPANVGAVVPRGFPAALSRGERRLFRTGSGRRELAAAICDDAGALAARVMVNRVWQHHFGRGLVTTASNFGLQAEPPSHSQLLDDLAERFVAHGWSLKWLHREIVCSATYRQGAGTTESRRIDPDNVWLARMPLRRLDVEVWRDQILALSGSLETRLGGPPGDLAEGTNHRRTVYGIVKRRELADVLRLHDFPDPVMHSPERVSTLTPLQQLYVLNGPFLRDQASHLVDLAWREVPDADEPRLSWLFRRVFAVAPTPEELASVRDFLAEAVQKGAAPRTAWNQVAEAMLGSNRLLFSE